MCEMTWPQIDDLIQEHQGSSKRTCRQQTWKERRQLACHKPLLLGAGCPKTVCQEEASKNTGPGQFFQPLHASTRSFIEFALRRTGAACNHPGQCLGLSAGGSVDIQQLDDAQNVTTPPTSNKQFFESRAYSRLYMQISATQSPTHKGTATYKMTSCLQ